MYIRENGNPDRNHVWIWTALLGVFIFVLGVVTITISALATIAISWLAGLALIIGGIAQLSHALAHASEKGAIVRFLIATLTLFTGALILKTPAVGAVAITLVLAFYLLFGAAAKLVLAFESLRNTGKGWLIFSAVISLFLACCLFATLRLSSFFIPGTIVGVDLIFYGLSITVASVYLRNRSLEQDPSQNRRAA